MKTRNTSKIVGILFIIATVFYGLGITMYGSAVSGSGYLTNADMSRNLVLWGVLITIIATFAIMLIPVYLFPILRKQSKALALSYIGFRTLEAGFLLLEAAGVLTILSLSRKYLESGAEHLELFTLMGDTVHIMTSWVFFISVSLLFPVGAMVLNYLLFKLNLVPRFISGWGFLAAAHLLIGSILITFNLFEGTSGLVEALFTIPIALQEIVFAIWLIVKGFTDVGEEIESFPTDSN